MKYKEFYITRDATSSDDAHLFYSYWLGMPSLKNEEWVAEGNAYCVFCESREMWEELGFPKLKPGGITKVTLEISKIKEE